MIVWTIIGIIALASIILGISLHQAFWTLVGCIAGLALICYILTELWDWLGEIGEKKKAKSKEPKKDRKPLPKIVVLILTVIGVIIAVQYLIFTF